MPLPADPLAQLTARERQVAALVAQGLSSVRIATMLGLSAHTVRKHRANIMARLGLHHRTQLVELLHSREDDDPNACRRARCHAARPRSWRCSPRA